jgi:hypothetical protein
MRLVKLTKPPQVLLNFQHCCYSRNILIS